MAWYEIDDVDKIDSPALVIYPDRVKRNITLLKGMIDDISRIRTHVKSHKTKEAANLQIAAGINKFKCATIAEAEMLGMCKAADVLLAYQPVGPKIERFISLVVKYPETEFSCLVDSKHTAEAISVAALSHNLQIPVYIDLNVGMNRTGIAPNQDAIELYIYCAQLKGIKTIGLHAYDGHIHDADYDVRQIKAEAIYEQVINLQEKIFELSSVKPKVIIGGSPTFPIYALKPDVECSPGTFIYWDINYQQLFKEQEFDIAALLVVRVVSLPDDTKICVDLGHKAVAAESDLNKRVAFLNAPQLQPVSQSEEHMVLEAGKNHPFKPGDVLYGTPFHVCPTVALHNSGITIEHAKTTGEWVTIARNRKINI